MVNLRHCETARLAFLSASPRLFDCLDCKTEIETLRWLCEKIDTARHTEQIQNHSKSLTVRKLRDMRPILFERPFASPIIMDLCLFSVDFGCRISRRDHQRVNSLSSDWGVFSCAQDFGLYLFRGRRADHWQQLARIFCKSVEFPLTCLHMML